ncbi:MAG: 4-(cytidine 5'-diphospho)-2-C-methyl-D-erythritol kinase [Desulfovibrio sp.]|nr:4-(cytidine 5'-diphospho)-2-C-methyl-D-erythritol kinase [Desulfovibrio sp.]
MPITLKAPAKINLGLQITGKRADGYHELDSCFYPLSEPFDTLEIQLRASQGLELECLRADIPQDKNSLLLSYQALKKQGCELPGLFIRLNKGIPLGAGLGGGSSDAACLLRFLNSKLHAALSEAQLQKVALSVGADVPFFLRQEPARVRGLGEKLSACRCAFLPCWLLLVTPPLHIDTAWAYHEYDRLRNLGQSAPHALTKESFTSTLFLLLNEGEEGQSPKKLAWSLDNALELPVMSTYPALAALKKRLAAFGAAAVAMSGSGSTLYALFPPNEENRASHALQELSRDNLRASLQFLGKK